MGSASVCIYIYICIYICIYIYVYIYIIWYNLGFNSEGNVEYRTINLIWVCSVVGYVLVVYDHFAENIQLLNSWMEWDFRPKDPSHTSGTAQGGGGSFKNRKPIGEIGCCESGIAERSHWWTERCLRSPDFLSLSVSFSDYLPCLSVVQCHSV